ncbi:metalloendopeptidase OMA1, mitochondrial [Gammaproteobacteria bacterium]
MNDLGRVRPSHRQMIGAGAYTLAAIMCVGGIVPSVKAEVLTKPDSLIKSDVVYPPYPPPSPSPQSLFIDSGRAECSNALSLIQNIGLGTVSGLAASSLITLTAGSLRFVSNLWWPMAGALGGYLIFDDSTSDRSAGCLNSESQPAEGVDVRKSRFLLVPRSWAENSADSQYQKTKIDAKQKGLLNANLEQVRRLNTIANRLIQHAGRFNADAQSWQWEINLLEAPIINAYCMPGGKIMVYSGIIEELHLTDDELAAIIGHEISHALLEHGRARMSEQLVKQIGLGILSFKLQLGNLAYAALAQASSLAISLPYSRKHETDADLAGIELAARAGYDPRAAVRVWQKMSSIGQGKPPQWLSTHPADENRIHDIEANLPKVLPLYESAQKSVSSASFHIHP